VIGEPISAANPPFRSFGQMAQTKINAPGSAPLNVSKQAINLSHSLNYVLFTLNPFADSSAVTPITPIGT
jgi:hypothetical protein